MAKKDNLIGWHFCSNDKRLSFSDGRHIRTGRTLKVKPPIKLCKRGLHASVKLIDALKYSQGDILCRVKLSGKIIKDNDKAVATERTVITMFNASKLLHEFACCCAERALKKAKVKDKRCWNAIKIKRLWLIGKATDKELATAKNGAARVTARVTAWNAAWATAWATARVTARNAAWDAAWATARNAAWDAVWATARVTARVTAWNAAWDTERRQQNEILTRMVAERQNHKNNP